MPVFNKHRELRDGKRYNTLPNSGMTATKISEHNDTLKTHKSNTNFEFEARILTQEEVDEQGRTYFAPLTKLLEDLTRLIQGMSSIHQINLPQRARTSANSSTAGPSLNIRC